VSVRGTYVAALLGCLRRCPLVPGGALAGSCSCCWLSPSACRRSSPGDYVRRR